MLARKRYRYQVDLPAEHAECETNYLRLRRLLPVISAGGGVVVGLPDGSSLAIDVIDVSPYTAVLACHIAGPLSELLPPELEVRVYHDARMAEVIACGRHRHFAPSYDYPNPGMYLPDEKAQLNRLFGQWLSHCLQHGHSLDAVALCG